jgi:hypothetical protein
MPLRRAAGARGASGGGGTIGGASAAVSWSAVREAGCMTGAGTSRL